MSIPFSQIDYFDQSWMIQNLLGWVFCCCSKKYSLILISRFAKQISIKYWLWRDDTLGNLFLSPFSVMDKSFTEWLDFHSLFLSLSLQTFLLVKIYERFRPCWNIGCINLIFHYYYSYSMVSNVTHKSKAKQTFIEISHMLKRSTS